MDRNSISRTIAGNVSRAIDASGSSVSTVAQAADIVELHLLACLRGIRDFEVTELCRVGGFLRIPASRFLEGTAA